MEADPSIDAYIDRAAPFARPLLVHLRALLVATCPEGQETLKWGVPTVTYRDKIICTMAAFKAHATFGFWQNRLVMGQEASVDSGSAMGQFGRLTSLADLPTDAALAAMIGRAMALIDSGTRAPRPLKHANPPIAMPDDLGAALARSPSARAAFDELPPGQQREYLKWIVGAKRADTRGKRLGITIAQLEEGKRLHWKYQGR